MGAFVFVLLDCVCSLTIHCVVWTQILTGSTMEERGIESLSRVPLHGFINDIAVGPKARFCVVAVGQEPRLGRWDRVPRAKNRFGIVQLRCEETESDSEEDAPEMGTTQVPDGESASSDENSEEEDS